MKKKLNKSIGEVPKKIGIDKIRTVLQNEYTKYDETIESTVKFANACEKLIMEIFKKYNPLTEKFNVEETRRMFTKLIGCEVDFNMEESVGLPWNSLAIDFQIENDKLLELLNKNNINLDLLKRILYDNLSNVLDSYEDNDAIKITQYETKTRFAVFIYIQAFLKCSDEIIDKKIEDSKMRVRKPE